MPTDTKTAETNNLFEQLSKVDVSAHLEKKNGLSYLSWAWAWTYIKRIDPLATRKFTKFDEYNSANQALTGRQVDYCKTDTGTYVECSLTIKGHTETETLFVMDYHNKAVLEPKQDQINKTKQRCMVKAAALHGLGLYVYAGEDLPTDDKEPSKKPQPVTKEQEKELDELYESLAGVTQKSIALVQRNFAELAKNKNMDIQTHDGAAWIIEAATQNLNKLVDEGAGKS